MGMGISPKNEARLRATAESEGLSVDAYVERVLNEREEMVAAVHRVSAQARPPSGEEIRVRIERGFSQSERGEVEDGEVFSDRLFAELDQMERTRSTG